MIDDRTGTEIGPDEETPAPEEYHAPTLTVLGDLATLTQFGGNPGGDGFGMS
jgi:hypothetical protein